MWTLLPALLLPWLGPSWRSRAYASTIAVALAVALPLSAAWPWFLHLRSPDLLAAWRAAEPLAGYFPFLPGSGAPAPGWLARNVVWFAWPAVPLILWTLWIRGRGFNGGWREPVRLVS